MYSSVPSVSKPGYRNRQPLAVRIQPQRRRARDDANSVQRPDRVVVGDALGVVPHPVRVDHPRAGLLRDADHPAVDVCRHAAEQLLGHAAHPLRPILAHQLVVPPMPPLVTITAAARNSNSPTAFRDEATPRGAVEDSSTVPGRPSPRHSRRSTRRPDGGARSAPWSGRAVDGRRSRPARARCPR